MLRSASNFSEMDISADPAKELHVNEEHVDDSVHVADPSLSHQNEQCLVVFGSYGSPGVGERRRLGIVPAAAQAAREATTRFRTKEGMSTALLINPLLEPCLERRTQGQGNKDRAFSPLRGYQCSEELLLTWRSRGISVA